ncbi:MAG TPA: outer membrane beta-barrel protein [Gemmatimonadales bacterium]|nr:outer membrane beta-barrel protein [Gemmatimonadales bacterium]
MSTRLTLLPGFLAALAILPASAQAQRVSLSPTIGVYIPTSELVKAAEGQEFKQEVALSVGGRLGVTVSPRFGIETSVSYVPSSLRFTFEETETTTDANLLLGTLRASFHAIPMTSPVWLTLSGGASMIRRGGEAYEDVEDRNDIGGVVGATVGFRLGSALSFYVAAEDYIYGTRVEDAELGDLSQTQNDVQIALGLGFPVGR